jgi:hypothetical protein
VQDLAFFERFVHIQDENQAGGVKILGIVPRKWDGESSDFCGLRQNFLIFSSIKGGRQEG